MAKLETLKNDRDSTGGGGGFVWRNSSGNRRDADGAHAQPSFSRTNLFTLLGGGGAAPAPGMSRPDPELDEKEKPMVQFVSFVLDDVQNTWTEILPEQADTTYHHAEVSAVSG